LPSQIHTDIAFCSLPCTCEQENAVGVSRQLYELHDQVGNLDEAAKFAEAALRSMQGLTGVKVCTADGTPPFLASF